MKAGDSILTLLFVQSWTCCFCFYYFQFSSTGITGALRRVECVAVHGSSSMNQDGSLHYAHREFCAISESFLK